METKSERATRSEENRGGGNAERTVADASVDPSGKKEKKTHTGADVNQHIREKRKKMVVAGRGGEGVRFSPPCKSLY